MYVYKDQLKKKIAFRWHWCCQSSDHNLGTTVLAVPFETNLDHHTIHIFDYRALSKLRGLKDGLRDGRKTIDIHQ